MNLMLGIEITDIAVLLAVGGPNMLAAQPPFYPGIYPGSGIFQASTDMGPVDNHMPAPGDR